MDNEKKQRLIFALWGALAGACNPIWPIILPAFIYVFNTGYDLQINNAADYIQIGASFSYLFALILFIPCFLSCLLLYPWLRDKMKTSNQIKTAFLFGLIASGLAIVFHAIGKMLMMKPLLSSLVFGTVLVPLIVPGLIVLAILYGKRWKKADTVTSTEP